MTREDILATIQEKFKDDIISVFEKSPKRVYIDITAESLTRIAPYVFNELGARFNIASGMDGRDEMEILYHFIVDEINLLISFRVKLPKDNLEIDSITPFFEAANWIEREMTEMLGITFKGHPDMRRLLLPDEWPEGVYPLRRDYEEWDKTAIRDRGV
ncbi:NADH-quinone oxidoreductase subunit C [Candidatus Omnitrophota bacterium]